MLQLFFTLFLSILLIRLIFRKIIDLPGYHGKTLVDDSGIVDTMPEDKFWKIIREAGLDSKRNYELQCQLLTERLEKLTSTEIIEFDRTFYTLMAKSYSYKLWEAAFALNGGCSDDCFEYFRSWLIAQGRNKFYWVNKFPRVLFLVGVKELIENYEGAAYCAMNAYQNRTGNSISNPTDIEYAEPGKFFSGTSAFLKYPELALLAW